MQEEFVPPQVHAYCGALNGENRDSDGFKIMEKMTQYNTARGRTLNALLGLCKECWDQNIECTPSLVGQHVSGAIIPKHAHRNFCLQVGAIFETWRENEKLHDFVDDFSRRFVDVLEQGRKLVITSGAASPPASLYREAVKNRVVKARDAALEGAGGMGRATNTGAPATTSRRGINNLDNLIERKCYVKSTKTVGITNWNRRASPALVPTSKILVAEEIGAPATRKTTPASAPHTRIVRLFAETQIDPVTIQDLPDLWADGGVFPNALRAADVVDGILLAPPTEEQADRRTSSPQRGGADMIPDLPVSLPPDAEYNEVTTLLMQQLRRSWGLTFDSVSKTKTKKFSLTDSIRVRNKLQAALRLYKTQAHNLAQKFWAAIESSLRRGSRCADTLPSADVTPYKILRAFFKVVTQTQQATAISPCPPVTGREEERSGAERALSSTLQHSFVNLVGSYAVALRHWQRARRCLELLHQGTKAEILLKAELHANPNCAGWDPHVHPEFLAFEIDADLSIRESQAEVALAILSESEGNRLLQLIMGGGKTAVIAPLVLAAAARGDKLVRATVLSPLYATNSADWQAKIGGLLDRQVFPLICTRDLRVDEQNAKNTLAMMKRVRRDGHVIVTVPEHRLSLENKAIELATPSVSNVSAKQQKKKTSKKKEEGPEGAAEPPEPDPEKVAASLKLHEALAFARRFGRDFLDESDEILSPKYQLIYTLGDRRDMDGGQVRLGELQCLRKNSWGGDSLQRIRNVGVGLRKNDFSPTIFHSYGHLSGRESRCRRETVAGAPLWSSAEVLWPWAGHVSNLDDDTQPDDQLRNCFEIHRLPFASATASSCEKSKWTITPWTTFAAGRGCNPPGTGRPAVGCVRPAVGFVRPAVAST